MGLSVSATAFVLKQVCIMCPVIQPGWGLHVSLCAPEFELCKPFLSATLFLALCCGPNCAGDSPGPCPPRPTVQWGRQACPETRTIQSMQDWGGGGLGVVGAQKGHLTQPGEQGGHPGGGGSVANTKRSPLFVQQLLSCITNG